jgi:hypothetical protein
MAIAMLETLPSCSGAPNIAEWVGFGKGDALL